MTPAPLWFVTVAITIDNTTIATVTQSPNPFVVGCDSNTGGQTVQANLSATAPGSGNVTVTVTSRLGQVTIYSVPITVT